MIVSVVPCVGSRLRITVTDEEADAEYEKIASAYSIDVAEVKKMIAAEDIKADLLASKAMALVKANANIK